MSKKSNPHKRPDHKSQASVASTPLPTATSNRQKLFAFLIVFVFGFLLYANSIPNDYAVDDTIVITSNSFTQAGTAGIGKIFTNDAFVGHYGERGKELVQGGRYRPLSIASFALEKQLFGSGKAGISHGINAFLYGLSGWILFYLLSLLFPIKEPKAVWLSLPFWASLLFLAHPLHTEAVANIKGRDEIFALLFSLIAWTASLIYYRKQNSVWAVIAWISFLLGIFSKENTVTYLAVIPLCLFVFEKFNLKRLLIIVLPMLLITVFFLLLREKYTNASHNEGLHEILNNPFIYSSFSQHYGTVISTFLIYLKLLFVPYPLTHDYYPYQVPVRELSDPVVILSILLNLGLFIYGLYLSWKKKPLGFAISYYFITFSVVSQLIFQVGTNMSERFMYMPSIGFVLAVLLLLQQWTNKNGLGIKAGAAYLLTAVVIVFSILTIQRNFDWKDNFSLFAADTPISSNSMKAHMEFGGELTDKAMANPDTTARKKMLAEAIDHLNKAIELYPKKDNDGKEIGYANAYNLLGNAWYNYNRDYNQSEHAYLMAAKYLPGHFDAFSNLVVIYIEQQKFDKALPYLKVLLANEPNSKRFVFQAAETYRGLNRFDTAISFYQKSMELDPGNQHECEYKIGICYARGLGRFDEGIAWLKKAYDSDPGNTVFTEDLAVAYGMKGTPAVAVPLLEKLIQLHPDYQNAYVNLIVTYTNLGDSKKAAEYTAKLNALRSGQKLP